MPLIDLTDLVFGRLTVISRAGRDKNRQAQWLCRCVCGNNIITRTDHLKSGSTTSCGCSKHGKSSHPLYGVWVNMRTRCNNPNYYKHHRYGGRGISVCKEWDSEFIDFYNWAISNGWRNDLQIDRIDNDGNYCPDNCRFVSSLDNNNNKSLIQANNKTGYAGVSFSKRAKAYKSELTVNYKTEHFGFFNTPEEAAEARDRFIIANNLPHKLHEKTLNFLLTSH